MQTTPSSKCSSTFENFRQQMHLIAHGISMQFVQEHHEVLHNKTELAVAIINVLFLLLFSSLLLHKPSGSNLRKS